MSGNILTSLLALIFYLTSGIFGSHGSHSAASQPGLASSTAATTAGLYPRNGIISSQQVNIRSAASNYASVVTTAKRGTGVTILGEQNGWMLVETPDTTKGWIAKWLVKPKKSLTYQNSSSKTIAGYYVENNSRDRAGYQALANNLPYINMVIPFSYKVDSYGTVLGSHNTKAASLAKSGGQKLLALVNNIQGANFNSNTVHRMLSNAAARSRAVSGITRLLINKGYHGVNIDFENVPARDRYYLTAFFRELSAALRPRGLLVTASVPAKTYDNTRSAHSGAYDYKALAPYLDQLMVMAYDEHYAGGTPGPVASYPWFEKVINYTLRYFPSQKIVMGIAAYGYDWTAKSGKARHTNAILQLIRKYRVVPKWHSKYRVPYFTYKSWGVKHQVWYENVHSTAAKLNLVKRYNLRGVAVWRLGYEDSGIWKVIREQLS
jgi:spore germination protein